MSATQGLRVIGEYTTVKETIAALSEGEVDIVLLDYDLGEEEGLSLLAELRKRNWSVKVLIVTAGMPDAATHRAMETGASGVFFKHNNLDQLVTAIHRVVEGEFWLDATSVRALVASGSMPGETLERKRPLTPRQGEVMRGILDGLTNKEIALKINCSESSVKAVIQELFHKAGVRTRSQLVRIAIEDRSADWMRS